MRQNRRVRQRLLKMLGVLVGAKERGTIVRMPPRRRQKAVTDEDLILAVNKATEGDAPSAVPEEQS